MRSNVLYYYAGPDSIEPRGQLVVRGPRSAVAPAAPSGPAALFFAEKKAVFPFKVNQGDEYERILAAGSEEARDAWVAALRAGLG